MNTQRQASQSYILVLLCALIAVSFATQSASAQTQPTAQEIIGNVKKPLEAIRDYTADMTAAIDIPGFQAPKMEAKVYYKQPDKLYVEAEGFAMVPRDVIAFNPRLFTEENYDMVAQGREKVRGIDCHKVRLLAKSDTLRIQRALLFIDPAKWHILKMQSDPNRGGSAEIDLEYMLVENQYTVLSKVTITLETPPMWKGTKQAIRDKMKEDGISKKGPSHIVVTYSNYRVNKGVDDAIFRRKAEK